MGPLRWMGLDMPVEGGSALHKWWPQRCPEGWGAVGYTGPGKNGVQATVNHGAGTEMSRAWGLGEPQQFAKLRPLGLKGSEAGVKEHWYHQWKANKAWPRGEWFSNEEDEGNYTLFLSALCQRENSWFTLHIFLNAKYLSITEMHSALEIRYEQEWDTIITKELSWESLTLERSRFWKDFLVTRSGLFLEDPQALILDCWIVFT